jgi:DNA ligase-1
MHFVGRQDLRAWLAEGDAIERFTEGIGRVPLDEDWLEDELGLPFHLAFTMRMLAAEDPGTKLESLHSIPFYSLCKALFLPLSGMANDKISAVFGFAADAPLDTVGREALLQRFLQKEVGLSLVQKLSCILGDPFRGGPATLKRDSLIRLLLSVELKSQRQLLDRLTIVGDVAVLFAESRPALKQTPALTAAEVLETLGSRAPCASISCARCSIAAASSRRTSWQS